MSENTDLDVLAGLIVNSFAEVSRNRALYANGFNPSGNTKRTKLWAEFGYPERLDFNQYYRMYERNAVAFGAVHKLLEGCWIDKPTIIDGEENKESTVTTPWEKSVTKLMKKHWRKIKDADRRNMIGRYSALLIQLKDGRTWDQPVDTAAVKRLGVKALVRLIPAWEAQVRAGNSDIDTLSDTYGQPVNYNFKEELADGTSRDITVHPDRILILAEGSEDDSMLSGIPLLRAVFNKLLDLEKISGGSAEGFLKNASRQLGINLSKDTNLRTIAEDAKKAGYSGLAEALNAQINKLNSGTDDALVTQDGDISVLSVAAADPQPSWEVSANEVSAGILMPFTILFGYQTGVLASEKDDKAWAGRLNGRRWGFLSDLVTELLERFWTLGVIEPPKSGEVTLAWSDLLAPSEKDKIANMKEMSEVAKNTQETFGVSIIEPNEIRSVGELEPIKNEDEPPIVPPGDPLVDEKAKGGDAANIPQQSGSDAIKQASQADAA